METYITKELISVLKSNPTTFPLDFSRLSITGHSMGGHGALTLYLKHPNLFKCASAFAPISNPTQCAWGNKAFTGYLAGGIEEGKSHDATCLIQKRGSVKDLKILVHSGLADTFHAQGQLRVESFVEAVNIKDGLSEGGVEVHLVEGYDHSYYFVSTFAVKHMEWHAQYLYQGKSG
jgi:S-formylglutathione hydrolase